MLYHVNARGNVYFWYERQSHFLLILFCLQKDQRPPTSLYSLTNPIHSAKMKFSTIIAITFLVAAVSAAPHSRKHHRGGDKNVNFEDKSNHEDNSNSNNKKIDQSIGSVGSTSNGGLLSGLLGGANVLGKSTTTNNVGQSANIN
ncbi:hypothetical protein MBANPS3_008761 [Mucor bainieri]